MTPAITSITAATPTPSSRQIATYPTLAPRLYALAAKKLGERCEPAPATFIFKDAYYKKMMVARELTTIMG